MITACLKRLRCLCFRIIHCTWVYPPDYYPVFFGYYFFNAVLVILLLLHIFWAYLILRMVKKFLFGSVSYAIIKPVLHTRKISLKAGKQETCTGSTFTLNVVLSKDIIGFFTPLNWIFKAHVAST